MRSSVHLRVGGVASVLGDVGVVVPSLRHRPSRVTPRSGTNRAFWAGGRSISSIVDQMGEDPEILAVVMVLDARSACSVLG
jgi:hypothetical protein